MGVAHQAQVGRAPGVTVGGGTVGGIGLRRGEVVGDLRGDQQPVREARQHGELVAARRRATGRHHRRRVPAEHGGGFLDGGDAGEARAQAVVGGLVGHLAPGPGQWGVRTLEVLRPGRQAAAG